MKIEQLTLENFKCFKSEKTFDFSRLTILTGANSSGKSSVMFAILAALQSDDYPYKLSLNGKYINLGDFKEISNDHKTDNVISIGLRISKQAHSNDYTFIDTKWVEDKTDMLPTLALDKLRSGIQLGTETHTFFSRVSPNMIKSQIDTINNHQLELQKKSNYVSAFRQSPRRTYYEQNNANYKVGTEGEEYIDQIVEWDKRSNGKIKKLIETMKSLDLIEDLKINRLGGGRFEVLIKPIKSNGFSALSDVGSGVSAFMPIVVADLQLPNDSTLFLQEPETHLHPSIQAKFADYIIHQINTTDKNYVIETHSEYILNRIRLAIVKGELEQEKLSAYFLENNPNDADVHKVEFTKTGGIRNAPESFFETYLMDIMEITLNAVAE
jgi:predicted ATPase